MTTLKGRAMFLFSDYQVSQTGIEATGKYLAKIVDEVITKPTPASSPASEFQTTTRRSVSSQVLREKKGGREILPTENFGLYFQEDCPPPPFSFLLK